MSESFRYNPEDKKEVELKDVIGLGLGILKFKKFVETSKENLESIKSNTINDIKDQPGMTPEIVQGAFLDTGKVWLQFKNQERVKELKIKTHVLNSLKSLEEEVKIGNEFDIFDELLKKRTKDEKSRLTDDENYGNVSEAQKQTMKDKFHNAESSEKSDDLSSALNVLWEALGGKK